MKQKQYCNRFNKDFKNSPHRKKKLFEKTGLERYINETMEELSSYSKILSYFSSKIFHISEILQERKY